MRPGWQTSEFWQGVAAIAVNTVVGLGVLQQVQGNSLAVALVFGILVVGNAAKAVAYVLARSKLKAATSERLPAQK